MDNKTKTGLTVGYLFAGIHLIWAILVASVPNALQTFFNWIFGLHGLAPLYTITSMTFMNAIILVIVTFITGYILGWLIAWLFSCCDCCSTGKRRR